MPLELSDEMFHRPAMELDLALVVRRAVVSMSGPMEWLTLKPVIFMTMKREWYMLAVFP